MAQIVTEPTSAPPDRASAGGQVGGDVVGRSPWDLFWRRFKGDKFAIAGVIFVVVIVTLALLAPVISNLVNKDPNQVFINKGFIKKGIFRIPFPKPPGSQFFLGVDSGGGDIFIKVIYGARTSLEVALFATFISVVVGIVVGLMSGFYRGKVDTFLSRVTDIFMSLPVLLFALGLAAACSLPPPGGGQAGCLGGLIKPGVPLVAYVIGLFSWPYISRIVRGQVLSLREKEFVEAARALGSSNRRIMFREILPNVAAPILVYTTLIIPNNILFEAALSFLGVGVPPTTPSWGQMLATASDSFQYAWWSMVFPGLFLFLTTVGFNLVGDGLRDALDPRTGR
jgi:ABC-type dipeptide/oligopeptide/nickel transport system permease subunit